MIKEYFKKQEYFIKQIRFFHERCYYSGNGVMLWNPDSGFHIAAHVERDIPLPLRKEVKSLSIDYGITLRIEMDDGTRCVAPNAIVSDTALSFGRLSLDHNRAIFIQNLERNITPSSWYGDAKYATTGNWMLPDVVIKETKIGDHSPGLSHSLSGLSHEDNSGQVVIGLLTSKNSLDVNWSLPLNLWSKTENWQFATGLRDAFSIVAGETVQLLHHTSYRHSRIYTEVRVEKKPHSLGLLFRLFDDDIPSKEVIIELANFLTRRSEASEVCRKIFRQLAEASAQKIWPAKELLLSTILEASLRTLYGYPFHPDKNRRSDSFHLEGALKKFREEHLTETVEMSRAWRKVTNKVGRVHRRLRHRNAHPDWLSGHGGTYSPEQMEQTLNDVIFLSRFYGYMILGLAGFKNLQPVFPKPFADWNPMLTIQRIADKNQE